MDPMYPLILSSSRNGNSSVVVRFRLRFAPQDSQPLSSTMEEEALRHGLAAALHEQGLSLAAYGTISSASLTGTLLPQLPGSQSKGPCAGAASTKGHTGKTTNRVSGSQTAAGLWLWVPSQGFMPSSNVRNGGAARHPRKPTKDALPGSQLHKTAAEAHLALGGC